MRGITQTAMSPLIGTNVVQYQMEAKTALEIGLLTDGATGCGWFAEWAQRKPTDMVYVYTFGGLIGGFVYGEAADFNTLAEFAGCADGVAAMIWAELQTAFDDFIFA
jgi:hypothetical protein